MGTHCAMIVRTPDGVITRYERTLDGYNLINAFWDWIPKRNLDHHLYPDPDTIGNGTLEINEEGECDQEYSLALDLRNKQFLFSFGISTREQIELLAKLLQDGWDLIQDQGDNPLLTALWDPSSMGRE